jgi:hypothetical protein
VAPGFRPEKVSGVRKKMIEGRGPVFVRLVWLKNKGEYSITKAPKGKNTKKE